MENFELSAIYNDPTVQLLNVIKLVKSDSCVKFFSWDFQALLVNESLSVELPLTLSSEQDVSKEGLPKKRVPAASTFI